jgi:hypothetical protein
MSAESNSSIFNCPFLPVTAFYWGQVVTVLLDQKCLGPPWTIFACTRTLLPDSTSKPVASANSRRPAADHNPQL